MLSYYPDLVNVTDGVRILFMLWLTLLIYFTSLGGIHGIDESRAEPPTK